MFTPKRYVTFVLTFLLGIGLTSLFTFVRNRGRAVPARDYELTGRLVKHSPDPIKVGDKVVFTYEVSNEGRSAIPAKSYDVEFYFDGKLVSFDRATSKIAEGKSITYSMTEGYWHVEDVTSGVHIYRLVLDPGNRLAERNESNNIIEGKFDLTE